MNAVAEALGLAPETSNLMVIEEIKRVKAQASQFNRDRIALGYAICDAIGIDGSQMSDEAIVNQVKRMAQGFNLAKDELRRLASERDQAQADRDNYKSQLDKAQKEFIQAEAVDRFERNISTESWTMGEVPEIGPQADAIETPAERLLWSLMGQLADNLDGAEAKAGLDAIVKNLLEEIKTK